MIRVALLAVALGLAFWIVDDYRADPMCHICSASTADWVFIATKGPTP